MGQIIATDGSSFGMVSIALLSCRLCMPTLVSRAMSQSCQAQMQVVAGLLCSLLSGTWIKRPSCSHLVAYQNTVADQKRDQ